MYKVLALFIILCFYQVRSQSNFVKQNNELNIQTKFKMYGSLFENSSRNSPINAQFNKGQKCIVISYIGHKKFKIEYKKRVGYVTLEYLVINDELEEVIKEYDDSKTIEIEKEVSDAVHQESNIIEAQEKNKQIAPLGIDVKRDDDIEKIKAESKINQQSDNADQVELRSNCHYQMNEIDEFYKVKIVKTENYRVNDDLKMELYRTGNKKYVFINFDGNLGCASYFSHNRSYAKITLENNTVVTIYHSWNVDCENFSLKGDLTNYTISKLKESPIRSIKLQGTKDYIEIENIEFKEFFVKKLDCLE